ncbi:hypothetical protein CANARDRAFT_29974 [[Candida] arabinofermentans NRRL YB-2248]|uniref:Altered inheritance of mitochondria protein 36, mitochondrial n=1 Tax=[Candida] arabinofermentans NRRL YB-2248 TaxID=983967 RepID=A0A1E4SVM4_9ASCO|nr:hypothetical protein CANARDRAFT_29974 [[Candida] arabinofermentans NRRL YB-2248]
MFARSLNRCLKCPSIIPRTHTLPRTPTLSLSRNYGFDSRRDEGPKVRYFLLVALIGTLIFGAVVKKVDAQDPAKSLGKKKNSFSEEEWEQQLQLIKRKKLLFDNSFDFYLVPFGADANINQLKEKVSTSNSNSNVGVIDLNKLIKDQLDDNNSRYGSILSQTLDQFNKDSKTCFYKFNYKLSNGLFTKLISDEINDLINEDPNLNKFILLNYPNTIPEAIKFEQDVAIAKNLVLINDKAEKNDIVDYFKTVNKVINIKDL